MRRACLDVTCDLVCEDFGGERLGCADDMALRQPLLRAAWESEAAPHLRLHNVPALRAVGSAPWRAVLGHPGSPTGLATAARRARVHVSAARHGTGLCKGGLTLLSWTFCSTGDYRQRKVTQHCSRGIPEDLAACNRYLQLYKVTHGQ